MDFLEEYGINEDTINKMVDINTPENIYNFIENEYNVRQILSFLKENKVSNIEELLTTEISFFLDTLEEFKKRFNLNNKEN
ncbi:MAG: hypothetical protein ACI4OT_03060 [Bacilli bacterium]